MTRKILITGANGGIGQALCEVFREAGFLVIGTDISPSAKAKCDHYIQQDLARVIDDASAATAFYDKVDAQDGNLVGLINNAAVQILGGLAELDVADFRKTQDINVTAPLVLSKLFLDALSKGGGSILNIGSIHASLTKPGFVSYATSKAALRGLTQAMAVDIGSNVPVNAIEPAAVETDMLRQGFENDSRALGALRAHHPTNCLGQPAEVARLALMVIDERLPFLNGSILNIDGGIRARLNDPK